MREAAYADSTLTIAELRDLTRAATALGVADDFDDLATTPGTRTTPAAAAQAGPYRGHPVAVRRCGHCRTPGHYRSSCTDLVAPA